MGRNKLLAVIRKHLFTKAVEEGKVKDNAGSNRAAMKRNRKSINRRRRKLARVQRQRSSR